MAGSFSIGFAIIVFLFHSRFLRFPQLCSCGNLTLACDERERQALLKFKDSFRHDRLSYEHKFASWNGEDCCKWNGIGCDGITGHVVTIDLGAESNDDSDMLFAGAVAPSLVELKYLNHLDLSGNDFQFSGIPSFFGLMKHLMYLNLSDGSFSGSIPLQLGNLTNLQILDLSGGSGLNGSSFHCVSQLSSLQYIDMSGVC